MNRLVALCLVGFSFCLVSEARRVEANRATSPYATILEAEIANGSLLTSQTAEKAIQSEIKSQLKFLVGLMNGKWGGAAIDYSLQVELGESEARAEMRVQSYRARLWLAWNRGVALPSSMVVTLPERGDAKGLQEFHAAYGARCASEQHGWSSFFYDYRPDRCELGSGALPKLSVRLPMKLTVKASQGDKSPEYEKVWSDDVVKAVAIFGNTVSRDAGRNAQGLVSFLVKWFGQPVSSASSPHAGFGLQDLEFSVGRGRLAVSVFSVLEGNVQSVGEEFRAALDERTPRADFVSYSGHSGLGANIRAFARLGKYEAGQYKILFLNGCDTFSYLSPEMIERHHQLNPEASPTKYVDVITAVMPNPFDAMAYTSARVIAALVQGNESYHQILRQIGNAMPVVVGEEDNG